MEESGPEEAQDITPDDLIRGYTNNLIEGQELAVNYEGNNYFLLYEGMEGDKALFFVDPPGDEVSLRLEENKKIDFNNDYVYDLLLKFSEKSENESITVYIKLISETFSTTESQDNIAYNQNNYSNSETPNSLNVSHNQNNSSTNKKSLISFIKKNLAGLVPDLIILIAILAFAILTVLIIYKIYEEKTKKNFSEEFPAYDPNEDNSGFK
jgi:hypothetical protein